MSKDKTFGERTYALAADLRAFAEKARADLDGLLAERDKVLAETIPETSEAGAHAALLSVAGAADDMRRALVGVGSTAAALGQVSTAPAEEPTPKAAAKTRTT